MFFKKGIPKNFTNFTGKHCWSLFLINVFFLFFIGTPCFWVSNLASNELLIAPVFHPSLLEYLKMQLDVIVVRIK